MCPIASRPSRHPWSDGKSMQGGRLLQVTNTCEAAVGERVQCCDRENSGRAFVRSEDADCSAIARLAAFRACAGYTSVSIDADESAD